MGQVPEAILKISVCKHLDIWVLSQVSISHNIKKENMVSTNLYPLPSLICLLVHTFLGIVQIVCVYLIIIILNYMSKKYSVCRKTNSEALPNCLSSRALSKVGWPALAISFIQPSLVIDCWMLLIIVGISTD